MPSSSYTGGSGGGLSVPSSSGIVSGFCGSNTPNALFWLDDRVWRGFSSLPAFEYTSDVGRPLSDGRCCEMEGRLNASEPDGYFPPTVVPGLEKDSNEE